MVLAALSRISANQEKGAQPLNSAQTLSAAGLATIALRGVEPSHIEPSHIEPSHVVRAAAPQDRLASEG